MIADNIQNQILTIWNNYINDNKKVLDIKGNEYSNIDQRRIEAIEMLKVIIQDFIVNDIDLAEFKTDIDSYNKKNNLWGFTSIKGQMFFNLLFKTSDNEGRLQELTELLKQCITEPTDLTDALNKIEALEDYVISIFQNAPDKRKVPNPGSISYFLSYFWQVHNHSNWPIMYSSMIESFMDIGLWQHLNSQKEAYECFYNLNDEIKLILKKHTGKSVSNWEAEHSFWHLRHSKNNLKPASSTNVELILSNEQEQASVLQEASFDIYNYIPRIVENLIDLGRASDVSSSDKGAKYEKAVGEIFKQLGFSVHLMGQGHRDADLIAIYKEEHTAFIVDAKAYSNGYLLSASDERAIREYISYHCPKLKRDGIQRIGFIIVSNLFKSGFEDFINDITWKTDIKRFTLLTSDALLHLLAYRIKDQKTVIEIVDALISLGTHIKHSDIVQKFDDI
jgi:hypothetical protein